MEKSQCFHKWYWTNKIFIYKKVNLDTDFAPFTKINSEWTIHLNVKYKTITYLEDNIGENKDNICLGHDFFDTTPKL